MIAVTAVGTALRRRRQLVTEAWSFLAIGLLSMLAYTGTIMGLVELADVHPVAATAAGFTTGTVVSYLGNTLISFRGRITTSTMMRFTVATLVGFALNLGIMQAALLIGLPYWAGITAVMATVPAFNFCTHKFWTYNKAPSVRD